MKSNLSGEFTIVNEYLVRDLKKLGLWDDVMVMDLKHFDGSLRRIDRVPEDLNALYATAFEIETQWLVEAAARRQKWIDLSTVGATHAEKSTVKAGHMNAVSSDGGVSSSAARSTAAASVAAVDSSMSLNHVDPATDMKFCAIDNPDCEACQ